MYTKNLTEDLRLRLSKTDMDYLRALSEDRSVSVSECIRSIIGEHRRATQALETLSEAFRLVKENKEGELSHGDTEAHIDDII